MVALKTMAIQINIQVAKRHLPNLLKRLQSGEEIMIAKRGKPIARLQPLSSTEAIGHQLGNGAELSAWLSSRALRGQQRDHELIEADIQDIKSSWH